MEKFLTFDIGGTDLKYGILNSDYSFEYKNSIPSKGNISGQLILEDIVQISKKLKAKYNVKGLAISSAGVINSKTGLVLSATNSIKNYTGINIISFLEHELQIPVTVENDVNCMALCEATMGAGKDYNNLIALTIGTGIGGSVVINKQILHGNSFSTGEFGLMIINGAPYEENASMASLVKNAINKLDPNIKNGIEVFEQFDKGYYQAKMIVNNFYDSLAIGIVNIVYVTNPEIVILGGGITNRSLFLDELTPHIQKYLRKWEMENTKFAIAQYKNDAGMLGALVHHFNIFKKQ